MFVFFRKFANGGGSLGRHEQVEAPSDPAEPKEDHETAIPGWHFKPLLAPFWATFVNAQRCPKEGSLFDQGNDFHDCDLNYR